MLLVSFVFFPGNFILVPFRPHRKPGRYLLTVSRKRNQNEFAWQNTKKLTTHLILALMCFLFFQANFILVPFPAHRQQVPSWTVLVDGEQETEPE